MAFVLLQLGAICLLTTVIEISATRPKFYLAKTIPARADVQGGPDDQRRGAFTAYNDNLNYKMYDASYDEPEASSRLNYLAREARDLRGEDVIEIQSKSRKRKFERMERRRPTARRHGAKQDLRGKPNIVFLLTDDQDIELGSMSFMPRTLKILGEEGAHFPNAYVTTPMCCPSRSSILTGLYTHNHNVYTNNDNCSSLQWQREYEPKTFATYLNNIGYHTAFFGKYLNEYNGSYIPPGWSEWSALIRNSRFYNYTLNVNGRKVKHGDDYSMDYFPDLIINNSLSYLHHSKRHSANTPVMMVLSFPTPHGPEDAAPQYQHLFHNVTTHRTPSWDFAPNPDKQWLLRHTKSMEQIHIDFTDLLHTRRLQTLQSVDTAVERLYNTLVQLGELENTYIVYTSDHGYHLGQFGLVKGKSMPFEFDVRVPFYVRGPKVPPGVRISEIVLNIDLAPTFLDMAGIPVPKYIDGQSFLPLLRKAYSSSINTDDQGLENRLLRDSFLIERRKTFGDLEKPLEAVTSSTKLTAKNRIAELCERGEYQGPCTFYQKWHCVIVNGHFRMKRCKRRYWDRNYKDCICPKPASDDVRPFRDGDFSDFQHDDYENEDSSHNLDTFERRLQRRFLKEHVNRTFRPNFIRTRGKREEIRAEKEFDVSDVFELSKILDMASANKLEDSEKHREPRSRKRCTVLSNKTISCPPEVYENKEVWRRKKERVEHLIKKLRLKLEELKGIRRHLKGRRPTSEPEKCECRKIRTPNYEDFWVSRHFRRKHGQFGEKRMRKKDKKLRRKMKFENTTCNFEKMNCFTQDNQHWKTAPFWTKGPFCFCQNANNNSFWCLRTINETHNFLYCEFITGFLTYYDLRVDPYQVRKLPGVTSFHYYLFAAEKPYIGARFWSTRFNAKAITNFERMQRGQRLQCSPSRVVPADEKRTVILTSHIPVRRFKYTAATTALRWKRHPHVLSKRLAVDFSIPPFTELDMLH